MLFYKMCRNSDKSCHLQGTQHRNTHWFHKRASRCNYVWIWRTHTHTCTVKLSWTIKSLRTHRDGATHMLSSVRSHLHPQPLQKHISVSGSLFNATSRSLAEIRRHTGGLAELPRSGPHHTHTHGKLQNIQQPLYPDGVQRFGGEPRCSVYC